MIGKVACVGKKRKAYMYLVGNLQERNHLEDLDTDGRMTLKRTINKQDARVWVGFIWLRRGTNFRLFHMVTNISVPLNAVSSIINRGSVSFARGTLLNGVS
jgi:hypothetical protein